MRKIVAAFTFMFLSALASGQTATVTGHIITGQNTASSSGISVLFELTNDNTQQCKVGGTGLVMPMTATFTQAQLAAGVSLLRNDQITCGTTTGGTRWRYTIKSGGIGTRPCSLNITGTTNLDSTSCLNAVSTPVTVTPTDSVYARLDGSNAGFTGNITAKSIEAVRYADQFTGSDEGAKIQAAINDLPATGGIVDATAFVANISAAATITISKPCWLRFGGVFLALSGAPGINITSDNVVVSGITGSPNSNSLGTTIAGNTATNTVFQTNSFNTVIRDMRITRGVVKTAGDAINITGGGEGVFQNLRIDNTFNGIVMTGGQGAFRDIYITGSQAMGAGIQIGPVTSGTVTSSTFVNVQVNGGTATWSDAYLVLDSGTDGMTFLGSQFVQGTNRATGVNIRNTSTANDPEWTVFTGCQMEGGSDHPGIQIDAARGLTISSSVIQGLQGILITGGRDIRIANNQIYRNQNEGIKVTAAVPLLNIIGNGFGDNGLATNNTFDDIFINAAVIGFNIVGNTFGDIAGDAPANKPRNNINVANTAASGFNIVGNNMENSTEATGFVANSSTTGHWNIAANTPVASIPNDLRGSLTVATTFGAGGGKLGITSAGIISTYNNTATAGQGVAWIPGSTSQKAETTADTNVLTVTPPATAGSYRIRFMLSISAAASAVVGWTATWTDSNGAAQTPTNLSLIQSGTATPALTFTTSAAGNYYGEANIDINNAGTAIVIKFTLASGTITAKASATIERVI